MSDAIENVTTKSEVEAIVKERLDVNLDEQREVGQEQVKQRKSAVREMGGTIARDGTVSFADSNVKEGLDLARFALTVAASERMKKPVIEVAKNWATRGVVGRSCKSAERVVAALEGETKALSESIGEDGGFLVPEQMAREIIPLLRATAVVRGSGVRQMPMPNGNFNQNFGNSPSEANYIGELEYIPVSQPSFGQLSLNAKKLAALVPMSNDLLRDAVPEFEPYVRDDIMQVMALREDLAFLRSVGSEFSPKGMRYIAENVVAATDDGGSITVATVTNDLCAALETLETLEIPGTRLCWFFSPRTKYFLMCQRGSDDQYIWRDEMLRGTLMGVPFRTTTQIPNDLGGGTESEIYLADCAELMIGDSLAMTMDAFPGGAYQTNSGGTIRAGISTDETVLRAIARHDFGARQRGKEVYVIDQVDWFN